MEIQKAERDQIVAMCERWLKQPTLELEATFVQPEELWNDAWDTTATMRKMPLSPGIPYTNYVAVQRRLQQVGLLHDPLQDTLNILTAGNYRWTITGMDDIRRYCETESLDGISYTVMTKTNVEDIPTLQNAEYGWRLKARTETPIDLDTDATARGQLEKWAEVEKSYRLIRRFSFYSPDKLPGVRIDVSAIAEETKYPTRQGLRKTRILRHGPRKYEVEVELAREGDHDAITLTNNLIRSATLVLQGIQGNFNLVKASEAKRVRLWYSGLVKFRPSKYRQKPNFIGPNPVTLSRMNMTVVSQPLYPNIINESYNVTDKADGNRCFLLVDGEGGVYLMDASMHIYATGWRIRTDLAAAAAVQETVLEGGAVATAKSATVARARKPTGDSLLNTVLDCEFVTRTKEGKLIWHALIFDAYFVSGIDVRSLPFREEAALDDISRIAMDRFSKMKMWFQRYEATREALRTSPNNVVVRVKDFYFGSATTPVLSQASGLLRREHKGEFEYHTDGLIFTPNSYAVGATRIGEQPPRETGKRWAQQFKWKPPEENTIDFLVRVRRDPITGREMIQASRQRDGSVRFYKIFDLYSAGTQFDAVQDPYTVFMQTPITAGRPAEDTSKELNQFAEVLFQPLEPEDPMASISYMFVEPRSDAIVEDEDAPATIPFDGIVWTVGDNPEQIISDTVVEMRYNPTAAAGWRWEPLRIRHDKTERYHISKAQRRQEGSVMNAVDVAMSVWKTLHAPVTVDNILAARGLDEAAVQAYFSAETSDEMRGTTAPLRKFHNQFIKDTLLLQTVAVRSADGKRGPAVWDIGSGTGQDIHKYNRNGYEFALMTDATEDNIKNPYRGASWLALQKLRERERAGDVTSQRKTDIIFAWADAANALENGDAGLSQTDKDVLKTLFTVPERTAYREYPETVANFIRVKELAGAASRGFDVVSCMFTLHYFFEKEEALNGLLRNIERHLRVGGNIVMANFDGEVVYKLLYPLEKGQTYVRRDARGNEMWHITKLYDNVGATLESTYGLKIAVSFYRVTDTYVEYLVPNRLLVDRMAEIGCVPAAGIGSRGDHAELLAAGTGMFGDAYHVAIGENRTLFEMSPEMLEYSELNRWYIFKRERRATTAEIDAAPHHELKLNDTTEVAVKSVAPPKGKTPVVAIVSERPGAVSPLVATPPDDEAVGSKPIIIKRRKPVEPPVIIKPRRKVAETPAGTPAEEPAVIIKPRRKVVATPAEEQPPIIIKRKKKD